MAGQAVRGCGVVLHRLATVALLAAILALTGLAGLSWRLSQGPLAVPWLAHRLEQAANDRDSTARLTIGTAALAWEGFHGGVDRPLDIRLTAMVLTDQNGQRLLDLPRGEVSLSIGALLLGRILPRSVLLEDLQLHLIRGPDGAIHFDRSAIAPDAPPPDPSALPKPADEVATATTLLDELARPPTNDRATDRVSRLSQVRRLVVRNADVAIIDERIGTTWQAKMPLLDLTRAVGGGVRGTAEASAVVGTQTVALHTNAEIAPGGAGTQLTVTLASVTPATLARQAPGLAMLSAVDAPVQATATIGLDHALGVQSWRINASAGAGSVEVAQSMQAIEGITIAVEGTGTQGELKMAQVQVRGHPGGPLTTVQVHGPLRRTQDSYQADLAVDLDRADFADIAQLWPEGVSRNGARPWIVENITAGIAHDGHVAISLEAPLSLSGVTVTAASGTLEGTDLTVHWLRPVPPIENGQARLHIIDPDDLELLVQGGRQRIDARRGGGAPVAASNGGAGNGASGPANTAGSGITIRDGRMRITGVAHKDQFAAIEGNLAGGVADAVTLLKHPRLELLSKHPVDLRDPGGQFEAKIELNFPLEHKLTVDQVVVHTVAKLSNVHLTSVAAGRDLDQGSATIDATTDQLKADGQAVIGGIPSQLTVEMDFRPGPASQTVQKISVSGRPTGAQLEAAGLSVGHSIGGATALQAVITKRRDGQGQMDLTADLVDTVLIASPLEWQKPAGRPGSARATVRLNKDQFVSMDGISIEGEGISVRGQADLAPGGIQLRFDRLVLGRSDATGTVFVPPEDSGRTIRANMKGSTIDLAARLTRRERPPSAPANPDAVGHPWAVQARFDRAITGEQTAVNGIVLDADSDGQIITRLHLDGRTTGNAGFRIDITPDRAGRKLTGSATDAGGLLAAMDISPNFRGGNLTLTGTYDDRSPAHPLSGRVDMTGFRLQNAPGFVKLLEAMTLYGLVDAMRGPGLEFTQFIAPFTLSDDVLTLGEARAFNSSLGLTATGTVDLARDSADIRGTIVPAYFFNSLLGRVPLLGRLFSPETGGGLFAASYTMHGAMADPQVSVNPLSALTPGFLRGLFKIF